MKYECHILRANLVPLGSAFAFNILLTGNWSIIAKIENALQNEPALEGSIIFERTKAKNHQENSLPYHAQIIGIDDTNIACEIWSFFTAQGMAIEQLSLNTGTSRTDTALFTLEIDLNVPTDISLASLREQFTSLCDEMNVDGTIKPIKSLD